MPTPEERLISMDEQVEKIEKNMNEVKSFLQLWKKDRAKLEQDGFKRIHQGIDNEEHGEYDDKKKETNFKWTMEASWSIVFFVGICIGFVIGHYVFVPYN